MACCFHCQAPVPPGVNLTLEIGGRPEPVCCSGCLAVARWIESSGLGRFYEFRSAPAQRAGRDPEAGRSDAEWQVCDRPAVERRFVRVLEPGRSELRCGIDGVNCAACAWLIDRGLGSLDGIEETLINPLSGETTVRFDPARVRPSAILAAIARFGFTPRPRPADSMEDTAAEATRAELKRLAVAGLGFAQIMTLSAALYLGAFKSMDPHFTGFFVLASMLVATPVVMYAGAPIFRGAWTDLAHRRLGMDVPVALAILIALGASLVNAFRGSGQVYFDSATMFVFFLTLGRFLESRARHRAAGVFTALAELKPVSATRRRGPSLERVGAIELVPDDHVLVAPGETVPADGVLVATQGLFDESLLSGESGGRRRQRGESVLGGSLNLSGGPVEIRITGIGADSYIERVGSLLQRAIADRPEFLRLADRWAGGFIAALLLLTTVAGSVWLQIAPERAFEVVLALLVVTCPCALSLAAPTAFAIALGRLARQGLLLRSARVLERFADVNSWLFDKTGTVTEGHVRVCAIEPLGPLDRSRCLAIAGALETGIEHPIARALQADLSPETHLESATEVEYRAGYGLTGTVAGRRYRLGSARHVGLDPEAGNTTQSIYLADQSGVLARFELADTLRAHAAEALAQLDRAGHSVALVSGDAPGPVQAAAQRLGIAQAFASRSPADKLTLLRELQQTGSVVAVVGDGINDAPVLAQADASIALVEGSRLAQAGAGILFTGKDLRLLARLPEWARRTRRVVRQNLAWAACYNLTAVPLAAAGLLAPWMAALGMSLSSLVVVLNALRLNRMLDTAAEGPEPAGRPRLVPKQEPA